MPVSTVIIGKAAVIQRMASAVGCEAFPTDVRPVKAVPEQARVLLLDGWFVPQLSACLRPLMLSPGSSRAFTVLSFLPTEVIRCYPPAALLDQEGVAVQRLPCSREALEQAVEGAMFFEGEQLVALARSAGSDIGQAVWSSARLLEASRAGQVNPLVHRRLDELERFAESRWPR